MEIVGNNFRAKLSKNEQDIFICIKCDYKCFRKYNFERHLMTAKHRKEIVGNDLEIMNEQNEQNDKWKQNYIKKTIEDHKKIDQNEQNEQKYICEQCNNKYDTQSGLWKHKKKCIYSNSNIKNNDIHNNDIHIKNNNINKDQLIMMLFKENAEFKELLIEQNKQNQSLQNQFIELAKDKSINYSNNNNSYNTTNSNNFNLQFFLNETCKDAMNINDFIEQIQLKLSDLEDTARLGYAEGISRIFIRGLKELEVNQRPIHCSDAKRETLYIKDGNTWEKDDLNKSKLTNAIKRVAQKNMKQIPEWKKEHPHCQDSSSRKNDLYLNIVSNAMSGSTDEEAETNYNKIKRNIIKEVIINK
jgi:hypothetical protein